MNILTSYKLIPIFNRLYHYKSHKNLVNIYEYINYMVTYKLFVKVASL